jgi:PAS domain S-box-containing protein
MAERIRTLDWTSHPLGAPPEWPQSLRSVLSICLSSRFPIVIYWGQDFRVFYNDAYAEILGKKHPWALGRPCKEVWSEIWDVIGPMLDRVLVLGEATWSNDQLLLLERRGYAEECYFSFSFSPVRGADGGVDGIFTAVIENTGRVLGERRLRTLRDIGTALVDAKSAEQACQFAASTLEANPADVPFALLYLVDPQTRCGALIANTGTGNAPVAAPVSFQLDGADNEVGWSLATVCRTGEPTRVAFSRSAALVLPLATAGDSVCAGVLVAGISPRRELDQEYKGFFEVVARRIAAAIAEARAYAAERRRAEALAELDRAKTVFFSNISHEFRTPLTLMLSPLQDMLALGGMPAAARDRLQVALRNSQRLLKLVNTLLDFSRIEAGRADASYEPVDLATFTAELAGLFRSAIESAGLALNVQCTALVEPVYIDREMWEKIVFNLLSNAFKFTFAGSITVSVQPVGKWVELAVADTGTGIPPDELPKIFTRFHRVKEARGRSYEGSGIGLALVQELVKLHGGSVEVTSEVDHGSVFRVCIPTGTAHLSPERIGSGRALASTGLRAEAYLQEMVQWLPVSRPPTAEIATTPSPALDGARVLVADDNADMREYLWRLLSQSGCSVVAVGDGERALQAARETPFDLILTDVMMPKLDGFGLLRALRASESTRAMPVILLSARAGEEARVEGMAAGADDYLIKPFAARELLARVEAHLKLVRLRREEQKRAADDLEAMTRLRDLAELCAATASHSEPPLQAILDIAIALTGADKGNIQLLDQDSGNLYIAVNRGFEQPFLRFFETVGVEDAAACGAALQAKQRTLAEDIAESPIFAGQASLKVLLDADVRAVQSTPLVSSAGRVFGMISTHFRQPHRFEERDLRRLDLLARQVADYMQRRQIEEALVQSEGRYRGIVDHSLAGIAETDSAGRFLTVNDRYCDMTGYTREELMKLAVRDLVHRDDALRTTEQQAMLVAKGQPYQIEKRYLRKDGSEIWVHNSHSAVLDSMGALQSFIVVSTDITARKEAEDARRLLIDELNHRAKNMLATVQSIATQSLRRTKTPAAFVSSFAGRIQALARAHSLLTQATWQDAELAAIIQDQLLIENGTDPRVSCMGPSVSLRPQAALHVALMIHELGTNARKYGALAYAQGRLAISWSLHANGIRTLRLKWSEDNGAGCKHPAIKEPGFGTALIQSIAGHGNAHMTSALRGVEWDITLALPQTASGRTNPSPQVGLGQNNAGSPTTIPTALSGKRVLIVEDEPLIALELMAMLEAARAHVVGPARSMRQARELIHEQTLDAALLDINLAEERTDELAAALLRRKVPLAFVSGYGRETLPPAFQTAALIAKPFRPEEVIAKLSELVGSASPTIAILQSQRR